MVTDKELLEWYYGGFDDALNNSVTIMSYSPDNYIQVRAYEIGANHALLGNDVSSFDSLSKERILKIVKDKKYCVNF